MKKILNKIVISLVFIIAPLVLIPLLVNANVAADSQTIIDNQIRGANTSDTPYNGAENTSVSSIQAGDGSGGGSGGGSSGGGSNTSTSNQINLTADLDKATYNPGETMDGVVSAVLTSNLNAVPGIIVTATIGGTNQTVTALDNTTGGNYITGSAGFTAPSTLGDYVMTITASAPQVTVTYVPGVCDGINADYWEAQPTYDGLGNVINAGGYWVCLTPPAQVPSYSYSGTPTVITSIDVPFSVVSSTNPTSSYCSGTVVGSVNSDGSPNGQYEGRSCAPFSKDSCGTSWVTHGCHWVTVNPNPNPTSAPNSNPRISYWWGKVNQHIDTVSQTWISDPDGVSGADIDKLAYCKKWYPNTINVVPSSTETIDHWRERGNIGDWLGTNKPTYACVSNSTPRISYWWGKVNQHIDTVSQTWISDPDGVSGADIDKLAYCKKWYPNTLNVVPSSTETIDHWRERGNIGDWLGTNKPTYACVQDSEPVSYVKVWTEQVPGANIHRDDFQKVLRGENTKVYWEARGLDSATAYCYSPQYLDANTGLPKKLPYVSSVAGIFPSFNAEGLISSKTFTVTCKDGATDIAAGTVVGRGTTTPTGGSGGGCFTANTMVILADGTQKNIQEVKVGDVLKGEKSNNIVLGLNRPQLDGKLYSINGGRYFVTDEHPFKTINGWKSIDPAKTLLKKIGVEVDALKIGDILVADKGLVEVKTIDSKIESNNTQLYNFFLDGDHTYYADGYLVHNKYAACGTTDCSGSGTPVDPGAGPSGMGGQVGGGGIPGLFSWTVTFGGSDNQPQQ